jgi:hypothetical protein
MQNLSTLRDSRLGGEMKGGGGGAENEIETKAVNAVAEEEQILDEGDPEAEAGWTQAVSICTVNRNTPRSEYPVNEVQRRSVAEPGSQDCVVLPSDTGFTAAYADVRLDIKQDRGRGFSQSMHRFAQYKPPHWWILGKIYRVECAFPWNSPSALDILPSNAPVGQLLRTCILPRGNQ